ncbi:MAG TPA: NUDIX hydrolase [Clostridia bacterium]|nr:NUDIX hydrolase [Clostridia bacterium]
MSQGLKGTQDKPQANAPQKAPSIRPFRIRRAEDDEIWVGEDYFRENILHVDPRFIGRIISVEVQDVRLPDGRETTREIVRHPGGACVIALDSEDAIYLVRQYRVGTGGPLREIPAGKLEPPEDAMSCARRELAEETGLSADRWDLLTRYFPSPGYTDEVITIYLARGLSQGFAQPDEGEFISCERILLSEAVEEVRQGTLTDGKTCLGILLAADRIKGLRS